MQRGRPRGLQNGSFDRGSSAGRGRLAACKADDELQVSCIKTTRWQKQEAPAESPAGASGGIGRASDGFSRAGRGSSSLPLLSLTLSFLLSPEE